jgi:hypothetical protein
MSHTKEPWIAVGKRIKQDLTIIGLSSDAGVTIGSASGGSTSGPYFVENDEEVAANARRIVACVNACAGIATDALELGRMSPDAFVTQESRADISEQQRDDLLAALTEYLAAEDNSVTPENDDDIAAMLRYADAEKDARAVIAKCLNPGNTACRNPIA